MSLLQEQFEELNGRLIETRKAIEERDRVLSLLEMIDRQLAEKLEERDFLVKMARSEKADVDKLEGLSVTAVLAKLLRNHEEKLEKEVAEYLEIKMGLEAHEIAIQSLQNNHQELEMMLVALADCDEEHEQAKAEQKQFLIEHNKVHPKKLAVFPELIAKEQRHLREVKEALKIGAIVDELMRELFRLISRSHSQGFYTGTGRIVLRAAEIEPQIKLYQLELEDIDSPFISPIDLNIPKFSAVMATDGTQYQEMRRIDNFKNWVAQLEHAYKRLQRKTAVLEEKKQSSEDEIAKYQAEQQKLIKKLWDQANPTIS